MDASTLVACFDASFSPNANIRVASELELRKLERLEGMPSCVLQIISLPSSSPSVKQAAAVYLKNRIARSWTIPWHAEGITSNDSHAGAGAGAASSSSNSTPTTASYSANGGSSATTTNRVGIADSDKTTIKQNILHVLVETPQQNVKVQLKTCLGTIIGEDFPEKYTELMHQVVQCIQSGQESHIEGGLLALIEVLKYYRYRRHDRNIPNNICQETMPMLVSLGQQLLASHPAPSAPNSIGHILHLIAKAYKISIVSDLSPHQASQESIVQWGTFLLQIVCRIIPEDAQPQDKDDRERWSWWKAKKWAHHVLNRLYNTYGSPSQLPTNRKSFATFAQNFEAHFAPEILKAYLRCVEQYANGQVWMSRRCVRFELEFFEDCVKPKVMWQQLKPHLDLLISRFVFPCLCLTDEEIEQFDDDPVEYCRAHFGDFIEDWFSSPLTAAISFIQILVKSRKATTFMPMLGTINSIVAQYPAERTAREKDGALRMLACVAETVVKTKGVGDQMQQFFVNYVFPEFTSKEGHLRVRALEMVEKFEEVDMAWPDSKRLTEMFGMVMTCVTDEALPVRVQAALALPELIRYDEVREGLGPNVGRLMQELLKMSEETDIDALSKPTRALVTNFPDELLPFATDISTTMRDSYLRLLNEVVETRAKHDPADLLANGLEGGLDDTDEKTIVAMNILQTLETLLRSIATAPPIVAQVETILMPVLSLTVQHEFIELYDDLFELAHSLTYYQRSISHNMWQFFEQMYHLFKGSGVDFVEEMNNVFDNFVSYGGQFLQNNPGYKNMFVDIFEESMQSDALGAQDRVSACKLAGQTLLCLKGAMDEHLHRYVDVAMHFATRKDTKEEPVVTQELHANCLELVVVALYYNPPLTLSILQKTGHLPDFFSQWFSKLSSFTRVHDRKICILAIAAMLSSVPAEMISMAGLPNQLLKAAVSLFEGLPKALERRKELEDEFGKEDDDDDDDVESEAEEDEELGDGDEDDVYDEDNAYQELLASRQKEMDLASAASALARANGNGQSGADGDDDDDEEDDEYEDEEGIFGSEQLFETPLDKLDAYQLFSQVIQGLQLNHGQLLQQATSTLTPQEQQALHGVIERAQQGGEKLANSATATAAPAS